MRTKGSGAASWLMQKDLPKVVGASSHTPHVGPQRVFMASWYWVQSLDIVSPKRSWYDADFSSWNEAMRSAGMSWATSHAGATVLKGVKWRRTLRVAISLKLWVEEEIRHDSRMLSVSALTMCLFGMDGGS